MKNNFKLNILIIFMIFFILNYSFSNETFIFDITEIEIKDNGNKYIGKNKGIAKSLDGTTIEANNFEYDKNKNILISSGQVKVYDPGNNVVIYSDKITYFKKDEFILAEGNSKAIDSEVEIESNNFEYDKLKEIIHAKGNVIINNKKENYSIYSDKITYFKKDEFILAEGNSKAIDLKLKLNQIILNMIS